MPMSKCGLRNFSANHDSALCRKALSVVPNQAIMLAGINSAVTKVPCFEMKSLILEVFNQ
jgi:hypothetical protein